jgi:TonB family protein
MRYLLFIVCFIHLSGVCQNYQDTIFYTAEWERVTDRTLADIYGFKNYNAEGKGPATYYWISGVLYSEQHEWNDLKHGYCVWYYKNGKKEAEGNYVNDQMSGKYIWYNEDGKISSVYNYPLLKEEKNTPIEIMEECIEFPDIDASYPGGASALMKFFADNISYPREELEKNIQGKVYLSFVVNSDGTISEIKVERGTGSNLDQEAIRVLSIMPNWIPGEYGGKKIRQRMRLPINFSLSE